MAKKVHAITNIRLVKTANGRIDGGEYHKPQFALLFDRNGSACRVDIRKHNGEKRPLGQDLIDAMRDYLRRGETTEDALLDCKIID